MTPPVPVTILPGRPRPAAPPLHVLVESAECSCDAGDDNPH
ncbi:hypothetical protein [Streptomyces lavendulocolor]